MAITGKEISLIQAGIDAMAENARRLARMTPEGREAERLAAKLERERKDAEALANNPLIPHMREGWTVEWPFGIKSPTASIRLSDHSVYEDGRLAYFEKMLFVHHDAVMGQSDYGYDCAARIGVKDIESAYELVDLLDKIGVIE